MEVKMQLKINKEIKDYTESIFFGLNMRQCFFSVVACLVAIGIYFLFIDKFGMETTSWLCILGAFPFALLGFVSFQSMNAEELFVIALRSFILSNTKLINKQRNLYLEIFGGGLNSGKKLRKVQKTKGRKV